MVEAFLKQDFSGVGTPTVNYGDGGDKNQDDKKKSQVRESKFAK